ncbi:MAG: hypothetical protein V7603_4861 [Micromonosporaceae bacterium]
MRVRRLRPGGRWTARRRRVLLRRRWRAVVYRAPLAALLALAGLLAGVVTAAVITSFLVPGAVVAGLLLLGFLAYALRVVPLAPAGRGRGWPGASGGGAGVREPRRPRPHSPAGAAARRLDDEDIALT